MVDYATCKSTKTSGVLINYNRSVEHSSLNNESTFKPFKSEEQSILITYIQEVTIRNRKKGSQRKPNYPQNPKSKYRDHLSLYRW